MRSFTPAPTCANTRVLDTVCALSHIAWAFVALRWLPEPDGNPAPSRDTSDSIDSRPAEDSDGAAFFFPDVQLAASLPCIFSPPAFSCQNILGELASAEGWKGVWDSPSVSRHLMLSFISKISPPCRIGRTKNGSRFREKCRFTVHGTMA
jgi:hypothetical protein